jgi:hypothetical protein
MTAFELSRVIIDNKPKTLPSNYREVFIKNFYDLIKHAASRGERRYAAGTIEECRQLFGIDIHYRFTLDDVRYFSNHVRSEGFEFCVRFNEYEQQRYKATPEIQMFEILW